MSSDHERATVEGKEYTFEANFRQPAMFADVVVVASELDTAKEVAEDTVREMQPAFEDPENAPEPTVTLESVKVVVDE